MNNKTIIEFGFSYHMKNSGDLGGCYPSLISIILHEILSLIH